MSIYERSSHVDAPLDEVWQFHSRPSGLEALTPDWMNLRVEETTGPDGADDLDTFVAGSTIVASVRPLDVGPRQRWTSVIQDRRKTAEHALFRDRMADGPFDHWEHTHRFSIDGDGTLVHDRIEYRLGSGPVGLLIDPVAFVGLEPMFRYRHRLTAELLE